MSRNCNDSNGNDAGRKRKADDAPDQPPAKQSRRIICTTAEVHASYEGPRNLVGENVARKIQNGDILSSEDCNIFNLKPSTDSGHVNIESGDDSHVSKKRSFEEAGLGEDECRIKKSKLSPCVTTKNSRSGVKPTETDKPKMMPWSEVEEGGEPMVPEKHPERYWIPDEWPESLAYK